MWELAGGAEADELYRTAIEHRERSKVDALRARAQLLYGEWLHRERPRDAAASQLRPAYDTFRRVRADGFAERARRELVAAGEIVHAPTAPPTERLTGREITIAQLAAEGHTDSEIAVQLFLSLRKARHRLRRKLKAALADPLASSGGHQALRRTSPDPQVPPRPVAAASAGTRTSTR
ncbi:hypothetical protein [Amycolatopsis sp. FDAARGOS 1241]|uniref:hypothetical protein n=1 Tax=Amycolatopsis sp. FDAARGOS 1241 TaxID=2778070 RepID=UPI00194FD5DE|nr:hypothetical protein [Amycolatopsis sp. FDAARGOS 1241]QRP48615.1 hypothetical protein I6J71_12695 [Amycolatopsis sp. FDAARGOS 1241]